MSINQAHRKESALTVDNLQEITNLMAQHPDTVA
jgi:hypothetical protein